MLRFGMFKQSISMSLKNMASNKMRSFLTMLGIIIGVTAVIALVTTVSGVTDFMMEQFASMGAGALTVNANGTALKQGLSENDLSEIAALDNVLGISPSVSVRTNVVRNGYVGNRTSVSGKNQWYFIRNDVVTYGRSLQVSDMAGDVNVCVIDQNCAALFFQGEDPLGKTIGIGGIQYTVIGLCGQDNSLMNSFNGGGGRGGTIYIPYKNALKMNGRNSVTSLEVYVKDAAMTDALVERLENLLSNTFNGADNAYSIMNLDSLLSTMTTMQGMMESLLGGIASIALLVGGIGIMNMMLVSVTERTKEIGLRKALGAEPGVIQLQFLMESVILSVVGGIIGIIFGELISYAATSFIGTTFTVDLSAIALGFGFSFGVGVIFGWVPARNASRLNPIDALRSE